MFNNETWSHRTLRKKIKNLFDSSPFLQYILRPFLWRSSRIVPSGRSPQILLFQYPAQLSICFGQPGIQGRFRLATEGAFCSHLTSSFSFSSEVAFAWLVCPQRSHLWNQLFLCLSSCSQNATVCSCTWKRSIRALCLWKCSTDVLRLKRLYPKMAMPSVGPFFLGGMSRRIFPLIEPAQLLHYVKR